MSERLTLIETCRATVRHGVSSDAEISTSPLSPGRSLDVPSAAPGNVPRIASSTPAAGAGRAAAVGTVLGTIVAPPRAASGFRRSPSFVLFPLCTALRIGCGTLAVVVDPGTALGIVAGTAGTLGPVLCCLHRSARRHVAALLLVAPVCTRPRIGFGILASAVGRGTAVGTVAGIAGAVPEDLCCRRSSPTPDLALLCSAVRTASDIAATGVGRGAAAADNVAGTPGAAPRGLGSSPGHPLSGSRLAPLSRTAARTVARTLSTSADHAAGSGTADGTAGAPLRGRGWPTHPSRPFSAAHGTVPRTGARTSVVAARLVDSGGTLACTARDAAGGRCCRRTRRRRPRGGRWRGKQGRRGGLLPWRWPYLEAQKRVRWDAEDGEYI